MKLLLDESLPQQLRHYFPGHETATVGWLGWSGIKNGRLLDLAEESDFEVLLTADQSIPFQQNLAKRQIAVVVFVAQYNALELYEPLVPDAREALKTIKPGEWVRVEG